MRIDAFLVSQQRENKKLLLEHIFMSVNTKIINKYILIRKMSFWVFKAQNLVSTSIVHFATASQQQVQNYPKTHFEMFMHHHVSRVLLDIIYCLCSLLIFICFSKTHFLLVYVDIITHTNQKSIARHLWMLYSGSRWRTGLFYHCKINIPWNRDTVNGI